MCEPELRGARALEANTVVEISQVEISDRNWYSYLNHVNVVPSKIHHGPSLCNDAYDVL